VAIMAKEIQQAVIDVLAKKTVRALKEFRPKTFILAGGVSANRALRKRFCEELEKLDWKIDFKTAPLELCTDNGVISALCGYFESKRKFKKYKIKAEPNLSI